MSTFLSDVVKLVLYIYDLNGFATITSVNKAKSSLDLVAIAILIICNVIIIHDDIIRSVTAILFLKTLASRESLVSNKIKFCFQCRKTIVFPVSFPGGTVHSVLREDENFARNMHCKPFFAVISTILKDGGNQTDDLN